MGNQASAFSQDNWGEVEAEVHVVQPEEWAPSIKNVSTPFDSGVQDKPALNPKFCVKVNVQEHLQVQERVMASGLPIFLECKVPVYSTLNLDFFRFWLSGYSDTNLIDFITYGWPLSHDSSRADPGIRKNHAGAKMFPKQIDEYIQKELLYGSILGPFERESLNMHVTISPINTVPTPGVSERRILCDLSSVFSEEFRSVNQGIPEKEYLGHPTNLQYPTVDDLVQLIKGWGPGCYLWKGILGTFTAKLEKKPKKAQNCRFLIRF